MENMVNVGLIGCGYWGKNHLRALSEMNDVQLKYVCDSVQPKVNLPRGIFTTSVDELLCDRGLQGVVIATPTATHYSLAKKFLEAGKHVFVEKPITTKTSEAEELCNIAEKRHSELMVGEIFRFNPAVNYLRELIEKRELGDLRYIESRRVGLGPVRTDVSALWDLATHDVYISNMLSGNQPRSVSYQGQSHNGHLDDIVCLNVKYNNGIISTIYVNWEHPIKERKLILGGTKKAVLFDDVEPSEKIRIYNRGVDYQPKSGEFGEFQTAIRDGDILIPKIKMAQPLDEELKHFVRCITNIEVCISSGRHGLETVKVLEAAEESRKRDGQEVRL